MKKEIVINAAMNEVRVAITEDGRLSEFYIELPDKERFIGNIYLGKVNRIMQGLNAAFVNIGLNQDAFLHFSDIDESMENSIISDEEDEGIIIDEEDDFASIELPPKIINASDTDIALRKAKPASNSVNLPVFSTKHSGDIKISLQKKQNVIVQIVREAYSNKGVKVTTKIALPGRYVVMLPFDSLRGISRKIPSIQERRRLRGIARKFPNQNYGFIIRTAAVGQQEDELNKDWANLIETWKDIEKKVKLLKPPALIYQDLELATSVIRDLFTAKFDHVYIDSKRLFKEISNYLKKNSSELIDKVELYTGSKPIFEEFGIEKELAITYKRKVFLQSGGTIIIEQTEAMVVIDVNSGRSTEKEQEVNALKTNIEAVKEIARQIRLRDIGGMIIVDFIDMMTDLNKKKIFAEMRRELSRDRAKTVAYPLTQLSLMQITRKRINQNIVEKTSETCPTCNGSGRVTSKVVILNAIERWLKEFRNKSKEFRLTLLVNPNIAAYLSEGTISRISRLMLKYFVKIKVEQSDQVLLDNFRFISARQQKDITNEFF